MFRKRKTQGFTLLELLTTLLITSVLAAIAIPAMGNWVESSRSKATRQQIHSFMSHARNYALQNSEIVTICSLGDGVSCSDNLEFPLTLFVDSDRNAVLGVDETILKVLNIALPEDASLEWNRNGYLRFWPSGGTGALTGSLSYCHSYDDKHEFRFVIARTGRTRVDFEDAQCD